jgi:hypothetical protein
MMIATCALGQSAVAQARLQPVASVVFSMEDSRFGGLSSIEIMPDGVSFMATSDQGHFLQGVLQRLDGQLNGVGDLRLTDLLDTKGAPLRSFHVDAEGLAVSHSGVVYISYEANHRVMRQDTPEALPRFMPKHPDFRRLINNSGLEALAIDENDVLYAIPERSGGLTLPFPVYRYREGAWDRTWEIPRIGEFLVVGADVFDGYLYVLERDLSVLGGFVSRIRRFRIGAETGEVLFESTPGQFDNLEGIALWQPPGGRVRALAISDDNFFFLQKTEIVEFELIERP